MTTTQTELSRARGFLARAHAAVSETVHPWTWGTAYLHRGYPRVWDLNLLSVDRFDGDPEYLVAEVHQIMGAVGCEHRRFWVPDHALGSELAPAFEEFGWEVDRHVIMVLRGGPDRVVDTSMVEEIGTAAWPGRELQLRSYPWCDDDDLVRQMRGFYESLYDAIHTRDFAVRIDGLPVSFALLYSDGRTGQIEDVATLDRYRRQGFSRAVMQHIISIARTEQHDMIFLVADDRDWPKDFYARLGFEPLGLEYFFLLAPEREGIT